jgi:hypothetical protein
MQRQWAPAGLNVRDLAGAERASDIIHAPGVWVGIPSSAPKGKRSADAEGRIYRIVATKIRFLGQARNAFTISPYPDPVPVSALQLTGMRRRVISEPEPAATPSKYAGKIWSTLGIRLPKNRPEARLNDAQSTLANANAI